MQLIMHPEISKWRTKQTVDLALMNDLRDTKQLQNLVARKLPDGKIQLLAGYRRHLALKALGKKPEEMDIKILENVTDEQAIQIAYSENNTREDLTMIEEARVFKSFTNLKRPRKLTHLEIAKKTARSESYVRDRLHLLEFPREVQKLMEQGKVPVSYSRQIRKLGPLGEQWQLALARKIASTQWDRIDSAEKAETFVEETLAAEQKRKNLVAKYGPCPKCGSANISEEHYSYDKEKLLCEKCRHQWNRETKEPWKVFELREDAAKLGLKVDITKNGRAGVTPQELTEIVDERTKVIAEIEKPNPAFRSKHTLLKMLQPIIGVIGSDNIQTLEVRGQIVNLKLIEDPKLYFKAIRKTYQSGEKSRVEVLEGWRDDEKIQQRIPAVKKFEESL